MPFEAVGTEAIGAEYYTDEADSSVFASFIKTTVAVKNHVDYVCETGGEALVELTTPSKLLIVATGLELATWSLE